MTDHLGAIRAAITRVAPDVELELLDPDDDFRDAAGLDSMDFLNVVIALRELTGIEIPERDYPKLSSLNELAAYLAAAAPA